MEQHAAIETSESLIRMDKSDFSLQVTNRSGVNINLCWQCKCCTAGCPFSWAMDYHPNQVIRLAQLGLKEEALKSSTIWICVGCNTCTMGCPNAIDMPAIMDVMREIALEENISIPEPDILLFHKAMLNSIERYGRVHKLEMMLRLKLQKLDFFSDVNVGLRMLAKRKLSLLPSRIDNLEHIKYLFQKSEKEKS